MRGPNKQFFQAFFLIFGGSQKWPLQDSVSLTLSMARGPDRPGALRRPYTASFYGSRKIGFELGQGLGFTSYIYTPSPAGGTRRFFE